MANNAMITYALTVLCLLAAANISCSQNEPSTNTILIDDFESGINIGKWWIKDSGTMNSLITISDDAKTGKHAAQISFEGEKSPQSWTDLYCKIKWAQNMESVSFWAKATKECKVNVKITQGLKHDETEMYGKSIAIGTEWKQYQIKLTDFDEVIFSHLQQDGKEPNKLPVKEKIYGIGFAEIDFPVSFLIDRLELR